jgi:ATP-dependent DNA helicase RecG
MRRSSQDAQTLSTLSGPVANLLSMPLTPTPRLALAATRISRRAFWRWFGRLEHERLEFKRSCANLQESVVAMAMNAGGVIVVGIGDDRVITGCVLDQEALDRIAFVAHETGVPVRARELRVGGTPVVTIAVPRLTDRVVTTSDGRILRRLGSANQPLRGEAVARFVLGRCAPVPATRAAGPDARRSA